MSAPSEVVATIRKNANEELRISVSQFHGHTLADVRVFVPVAALDCMTATKKGISVRIDMIDEVIAGLQDAKARATALGWWEATP